MTRLIALAAAVAALLLGATSFAPARSATAATDLRVIVQAQTDALNKGDLAGVMSYYADDVVVTGNVVCAQRCVGQAGTRPSIATQIAQHANYQIISLREPTTGNGTGRIRVVADAIKACGQQRVEADFTVKVADKITMQDVQFDLKDPQTAAFHRRAGETNRLHNLGLLECVVRVDRRSSQDAPLC